MRLALALVVALLLTLFSAFASADQPVIEEGRESDVLELLEPLELGADAAPGWKIWNVAIEPTRIVVGLKGPDEARAEVVFTHPDGEDGAERTPSFAATRSAPPSPAAGDAQARVIEAVRKNDDGKFWRAVRPLPSGKGYTPGVVRLGRSLLFDGVLMLVGLVLLVLVLTWRVLTGAPRWVRVLVPVAFGVGVALRLAFAPATFLGAWPWSRFWPHARTVFESGVLGAWVQRSGETVYATDVAFGVGLFYAALMPVVLFCHASQLLRDVRAGAFAAAAVALSPHHILFSRCEDAFVPSLVLTSTAFALLHTFLRDRARAVRVLALVALPFVLWPAYLLRPLNILFVPIFVFAAAMLHPEEAPRPRRLVGAAVVGGVGALAFFAFARTHGETLGDAGRTTAAWLGRVPLMLFDPDLNVLLRPSLTPPVTVVLAGVGVRALFRRGDRRLAWFLVAWLAAFFVAHAYVVEATMQPRYHLHLLVPLLCAAAAGAVHTWRVSRPAFYVVVGGLAVTPLLAGEALATPPGADQHEYAFVRHARDVVPEGCAVIEYVGDEHRHDARFGRIGLRAGGTSPERFRSIAITRGDGPDAFADAVRREAGACIYVYEGLACWGGKDLGEPYAPACAALESVPGLAAVAEEQVPATMYERRVLEGLRPDVTTVRLRLRRYNPSSASADQAR